MATWTLGFAPRPPPLPRSAWPTIAALGLFHAVGHVAACVAFARVAVPFFHVVKSAEPVFHGAILHCWHFLSNKSFGATARVAVPFFHVVKGTEPVFHGAIFYC